MKRWMRFRLRTLLVFVVVVAIALGIWPSLYNRIVLRPDEFEVVATEWLADLKSPDDEEFRGGGFGSGYGNFRIGNMELEVELNEDGEPWRYTRQRGALVRTNAYWIWPPGEWVESKDEAIHVWKQEYIKQHGWHWW